MRFCTAINCMDGRIQLPIIKYLQNRFNVEYVDNITEPGPNLILSERKDEVLVQSILDRLKLSMEKHDSSGVAVVGHQDCTRNPAPKEEQVEQIKVAIRFLILRGVNISVIGLWVNEHWQVEEILIEG